MFHKVFTTKDESFHWLDVVDPSGSDLEYLHQHYGIYLISLQDCLEPKHPPKYENLQEYIFIILRSYDEKSTMDASTIQELTQKISMFIGPNYLITLHRKEQPFLTQIRERWVKTLDLTENDILPQLLGRIVQGILSSYNTAFNNCETQLEDFEEVIFKENIDSQSIQDKFLIKRKAYVFKRVFKSTLDILPKLNMIQEYSTPLYQDLKEACENAYFEADNILDHVNGLISLNLSLASHGTNEIVKVLTFFSVFFMPLSLIASIYGMNFEYMPELKWHYGYPMVWVLMLCVALFLYLWFRKKGWLD